MQDSSEKQSKRELDKPILVFTNFWDADVSIKDGYVLASENDEFFKINLYKNSASKPENFEVNSIALQHPPLSNLPNISKSFGFLHTIDILCPTYDILMERKQGGTWEKYTKDFMSLIKDRKNEIRNWMNSLENKVYLLCCWENTSGNSKCHRQLIYEAMQKSKYAKEKLIMFYRHGFKKEIDISTLAEYGTSISMGEQGIEIENANVTKLKKVGLINDAARNKKNESIGSASFFGTASTQSMQLSSLSAPIFLSPPILENNGSLNNLIDYLTNDDDDDRLL